MSLNWHLSPRNGAIIIHYLVIFIVVAQSTLKSIFCGHSFISGRDTSVKYPNSIPSMPKSSLLERKNISFSLVIRNIFEPIYRAWEQNGISLVTFVRITAGKFRWQGILRTELWISFLCMLWLFSFWSTCYHTLIVSKFLILNPYAEFWSIVISYICYYILPMFITCRCLMCKC